MVLSWSWKRVGDGSGVDDVLSFNYTVHRVYYVYRSISHVGRYQRGKRQFSASGCLIAGIHRAPAFPLRFFSYALIPSVSSSLPNRPMANVWCFRCVGVFFCFRLSQLFISLLRVLHALFCSICCSSIRAVAPSNISLVLSLMLLETTIT